LQADGGSSVIRRWQVFEARKLATEALSARARASRDFDAKLKCFVARFSRLRIDSLPNCPRVDEDFPEVDGGSSGSSVSSIPRLIDSIFESI
jgi:hypothetical protein